MKKLIILGALTLVLAIVFWGCSDDDESITKPPVDPPIAETATCLGCHSSESLLKASLGTSSAPPIRLVATGDG